MRNGQEAIAIAPPAGVDFAADVRVALGGTGQKTLPSKYLYDPVGSALFEAICWLPEYGLTRADERLLNRHAAEIVERVPGSLVVAELGSGSGRKTRWLLEALALRQPVGYYPIDISHAALERCEQELCRLASVRVMPLEAEYFDGLSEVARLRRPGERLLVLFLGSTLGNFDRPVADAFLKRLRTALRPGDAVLVGTDLVKPIERLIAAYNDPAGVTAAFNRNVLARINRELDGDFDLARFTHVARYDDETRRVEMHLRSEGRQRVRIRGAGLSIVFEPGETIWTESSHKYGPRESIEMGERAGFRGEGQWLDQEWPFAETLLIAV
ncbi:MAG TPA: L-histidine N(alpha)-methyltransferase [Candidatus Limnocylindria bacterium]|nr:L-histidine N(alpha)-methyltransferase [Candidatus Limnocylindria bacterium]